MSEEFSIFCGNASRGLAAAVARAVGVRLGAATVQRFPDGEVSIQIGESVRDNIAATHGLFLAGARAKLSSESVAGVFVTDSVEQPVERWPAVHTVSVAPLIAETIQRVTSGRLVATPV